MMTEYQVVLALMQSGLTGEPSVLIEPIDWSAVLRMCERHQIVPLVYYGIIASGVTPDNKELFFDQTATAIMVEQQQILSLEELKCVFCEAGIDHMPVKGAIMKGFYPHSEMRTMSDLDILIRPDQYPLIEAIMRQRGYTFVLESDHEYIWKKPPFLNIELHKHLIPSYHQDYYQHFGTGWEFAHAEGEGTTFVLSPEDHFVYTFVHLTKHYRDGGIGFRHMVDLWILQQNSDLDMTVIEAAFTKLGLTVFYKNVMRTLRVWFAEDAEDATTQTITEWVVSGGTYGTRERNDAANITRETLMNVSLSTAKRNRLLRVLFPPLYAMRSRYSVLVRHPWFLPVLWLWRWISALFFRRKNVQSQAQMVQNFRQETVDAYCSDLAKVGLSFPRK